MKLPIPWLLCALMLGAISCGERAPDPAGNAGASASDALCSDAPIQNGDGTLTMVGCSFEQQTYNIHHHGSSVDGALVDGSGTSLGHVTRSCGSYFMGTDPAGTTVIVDGSTGAVLSHGRVHAGQPVSTLPDQVDLPVSIR